MKRAFIIFIALITAIICASCEKTKEDHVEVKTQLLRLNVQGALLSLHPHKGLDLFCRNYQKALSEGLMRIHENDRPEYALAEKHELSASGTRYTFTLRPSVWTNGEPVTAQHFKNSWLAALQPDSTCIRADLFYVIKNAKQIKQGKLPSEEIGITVLDDHTLVVDLEHPAPYFLSLIAQPIFFPLYDTNKEPMISNGPFKVVEYEAGKILVAQKNINYWDAEHVYLEEIVTTFVDDANTVLMMYETGEIDWVGAPFTFLPLDSIQHVEKAPDFLSKPNAAVYWYSCNVERPPLNSKKIRRALSIALDRHTLCDHLLFGETISKSVLPASLTFLKEEELYQDNDLITARKLFDEGIEELKISKESMEPLQISYSPIPGQKKLAETLQQVWENAFAIKIELIPMEWNVFFTNLMSKQFQLAGCSWFSAYNDATYNFELFKEVENRYNVSGFNNNTYRDLLYLADHEPDKELRAHHLREAELLFLDEMPIIPIYSLNAKCLIAHKIKGVIFSTLGEVDFKSAYIDDKIVQK